MTWRAFHGGKATINHGDSRDVLRTLADASIDSVVTDPPYALVSIVKRFGADDATPANPASGAYARASAGFMGQSWDTGETAFAVEFWADVFRVLKPGGHVVAFSGTRTYHRLALAIEDAGFEIRDQLAWVYGSGFPKSHDVAIGFEKTLAIALPIKVDGKDAKAWFYQDTGEPMRLKAPFRHDMANEWAGWGTALKPAWEPIVLARKPLIGTVAENVLAHGTGAINIDGCRIEATEGLTSGGNKTSSPLHMDRDASINRVAERVNGHAGGRFPANLIHDGSPEVLAGFPQTGKSRAGRIGNAGGGNVANLPTGAHSKGDPGFGDSGSAARFFYCAKASKRDRAGSKHPTVKPVDLMRWLVRLVTKPGGTVLEPFAGSGSTLQACLEEDVRVIGIEREATFFDDCCTRLSRIDGEPKPRRTPKTIEIEAEPASMAQPAKRREKPPVTPTFAQHSFLEAAE